MQPPKNFAAIIERKRYSTKTATILAGDNTWDGKSYERHGRNIFLYRTKKGRYFKVIVTRWISEDNTLTPIHRNDAIELYNILDNHFVEYDQAFKEQSNGLVLCCHPVDLSAGTI